MITESSSQSKESPSMNGELTAAEKEFLEQQMAWEDQIRHREEEEKKAFEERKTAYENIKPPYVQLREYVTTRFPNYCMKSKVTQVVVLCDKSSIFSSSIFNITVYFENEREISATRKDKDFEWLEYELLEELPGVFIKPLRLYREQYKKHGSSGSSKGEERVIRGRPFQLFLQEICMHPKAPNEATCLWDFLSATEKELEQARREQEIRLARLELLHNASFKLKKWKTNRQGIISVSSAEQNEKMRQYVKELHVALKYLYNNIPKYEFGLLQVRESYEVLGKEFKNYGNFDVVNHDLMHHVGDNMRDVGVMERERQQKKQNREAKFKAQIEFFLDLTGGDILGHFLDREMNARLEQEVLKTELENLIQRQEQLCLKIADVKMFQQQQQEIAEQVRKQQEIEKQEALQRQKEQEEKEKEFQKILAEEGGGMVPTVTTAPTNAATTVPPTSTQPSSSTNNPTKPAEPAKSLEEVELDKLIKLIIKDTNYYNRAQQRVWQICEYKMHEFFRIESELRQFLQTILVDSFCEGMAEDWVSVYNASSNCRTKKKINQMIEEFSIKEDDDQEYLRSRNRNNKRT